MVQKLNPAIRYAVLGGSALIALYGISYVVFRTQHTEVWEQDGNRYVIFPKQAMFVYYAYRPLTYADARLTGMRFHIGAHAESETQ